MAILAVLLLPVLSTAEERGRRTARQSNLRQFGIAQRLYVDDNTSRLLKSPERIGGLVYPIGMWAKDGVDAAQLSPGHYNVEAISP